MVLFISNVLFSVDENGDEFANPGLCYFVNEFLGHDKTHFLEILKNASLQEFNQTKLARACVVGNYLHILKVLVSLLNLSSEAFDEDLVWRAVISSNRDCLAFVCEQYNNSDKRKKLIDHRVRYGGQELSLISIATGRGDHSVVEYLLETQGFGKLITGEHMVLRTCVWKSFSDCERVIKDKIKIITMLVNRDPGLINDKNPKGGRVAVVTWGIHIELLTLLINLDADVNAVNQIGNTVLHNGCEYLTSEQFHRLVELLVSKNKTECFKLYNERGWNALHHALFYLEVLPETIRVLQSNGAALDPLSKNDSSLLHLAVEKKRNASVLNTLIECGECLQYKSKFGSSLLHMAAEFGNLTAFHVLIRHGINANNRDASNLNLTLLHYALSDWKPNLFETVRAVVEWGGAADVNARNQKGETPLHYAVRLKSPNLIGTIQYLITHGADLSIKENLSGKTMLHAAPEFVTPDEYHDIVKLLINNSLETVIRERTKNIECNALHYAMLLELKEETLKLLLNYVDINDASISGDHALMTAVENGRNGQFVDMMMRHGAAIQLRNKRDWNVLHWAALHGNVPALKFLLSLDQISVNDQNNTRSTPLHWAVGGKSENTLEVVRVLVEAGANTSIKNNRGQTAFDIAKDPLTKKFLQSRMSTI